MKALTLIAALAVSVSCASTGLWTADGKRIARFESNLENVEYTGNGVTFRASKMDNAAATLAQGQAAQGKIDSAGIALAASGITTLLK